HKKADQIYRIINAGTIRGNQVEIPLVSGPWGPAMVEEFPEVLKAVRIKPPDSRWVIEHGDRRFFDQHYFIFVVFRRSIAFFSIHPGLT
ncbi:MAG: hypothetical protein GQ536_02590, partial [Candidatus Aminicenantes bacterium]|nr:hypothetical protein [Candidatus Aminicenantes bacterium]